MRSLGSLHIVGNLRAVPGDTVEPEFSYLKAASLLRDRNHVWWNIPECDIHQEAGDDWKILPANLRYLFLP